MKQATVTIQNKVGIHARPASLLLSAVKQHESSVIIEKGEKRFTINNLIDLMRMQGKFGDELTIICEGTGESACLEAITSLFDSKFGEE